MIKKNIRINLRNKKENRSYKSKVKNLTKYFSRYIRIYDSRTNTSYSEYPYLNKARITLNKVNSAIDKSVKKNIFARNNGSRKKSRLAKVIYKRHQQILID